MFVGSFVSQFKQNSSLSEMSFIPFLSFLPNNKADLALESHL